MNKLCKEKLKKKTFVYRFDNVKIFQITDWNKNEKKII